MKYLAAALTLILSATNALAVDPPGLLAYKQKFIYALTNGPGSAFADIDNEYDERFVSLSVPQTTSINKTTTYAVYYDSVKVLTEFLELVHDRTGLTPEEIAVVDQIPAHIDKAKSILAQYYIQLSTWDGYVAFPHGLALKYSETGDAESWSGMYDLRRQNNWMLSDVATRDHIEYGRECAYSMQIGIMGAKFGIDGVINKLTNTQLMAAYKAHSMSQLEQWTTGNFLLLEVPDLQEFIAPFISGLAGASLIEYHDRVSADADIPVKIKAWLDWIYPLMWYPDVTNPPIPVGVTDYTQGNPGGAWRTRANWVTDHYDVGYTGSGVSAIHNMLLGHAYAWYAVHSGQSSYMDKALEMFSGWLANPPINNSSAQLWESTRYMHEFIRYYRKFYNTPCGSNAIEQCTTQSSCETTGGNWTGEYCRWQPVAVRTLTGLTSPGDGGGYKSLTIKPGNLSLQLSKPQGVRLR